MSFHGESPLKKINIEIVGITLLCAGGVQNRTNPIEKPQVEPTQTETVKNYIWFGCIRITFLLNRMVWFGLRFLFCQPSQTKPNRNLRKTLIKDTLPRLIFIETQWKLL